MDLEVFQSVVLGGDASAGIDGGAIEAGFVKMWLAHGFARVCGRSGGPGLDE